MKRFTVLMSLFLLLLDSAFAAQPASIPSAGNGINYRKLTLEPALGLNPMPMSDLVASNLVQWNVKKHFHVVTRSMASYNTAFSRNFNYVHTDYSYTLSQTIGFGSTIYFKRASHSFSLMAGIKYDATKETLNNPEFEKVSLALHTTSPDAGLMYNYKLGRNKYFFSFRMYLPLFPYPIKTYDFNAADGNMANVSLEFGVGIRLK